LKSIRTIIFFLFVLIVTFVLLAGRCLYLQYFKNEHFNKLSKSQQWGFKLQKPRRGVILDRRLRVLAASNRIQTIFAEPRIIKNPEETARKLSSILDTGAIDIYKLIKESKNPGFVKIETSAEAKQCEAAGKIYGIGVQSTWERNYPMGSLVSHVVGFTSLDGRGLEGVELKHDKQLRGSAAQNAFLADAFRRPVQPYRLGEEKNQKLTDGFGIILTIDATIQNYARKELIKQYENYEAESAVAIVAEPKTGEILAMVSIPDFDPAKARFAKKENLRNRVVTDQFEPGSILKPIVAAIALDAGAVSRSEKIFCENGSYSGKGFGRIGEYGNHNYGNMTVKEILIKSSNIGMAKIGQKLCKGRDGRKILYQGLTRFGFGKKTGIDLPGEVEGLLWPVDKWTGYSITRIPFGQEISVTAIQLVRAFCILANGGYCVSPYIVKAMIDNDGKIIKLTRPPPPVGFVIKPQVAKWIVNDALTAVVNEGTGKRAKLEKWQVFGKTGTANIAKKNQKGYSQDYYVASFIAGAPAEEPEIVVLVSIRQPNKKLGKGYTGGAVASPVAAKIIEKTLNYLEQR